MGIIKPFFDPFLVLPSLLAMFLPTNITPTMMQVSPNQFSVVSFLPRRRIAIIEVYNGYVAKIEAFALML